MKLEFDEYYIGRLRKQMRRIISKITIKVEKEEQIKYWDATLASIDLITDEINNFEEITEIFTRRLDNRIKYLESDIANLEKGNNKLRKENARLIENNKAKEER